MTNKKPDNGNPTFIDSWSNHRQNVENSILENIISNHETAYILMLIDISKFRLINSCYDYKVGDQLLYQLNERLMQTLEAKEMRVHLGADQFLVLKNIETNEERAINEAEKLAEIIEYPYDCGELKLAIKVNIAVIPLKKPFLLAEQLKYLEFVLSQCNQKIAYFNELTLKEYTYCCQMEKLVHRALQDGSLYCVYQPQINVRTNQVTAFEVLLRCNEPGLTPFTPDEFVNTVEKVGKIAELNRYVLARLLSEINEFAGQLIFPLTFSVNLSLATLDLKKDIEELIKIVNLANFDRNKIKIEFEITEACFTGSDEQFTDLIDQIHQSGILVSLDDFGVKYSSLSRLINFKFDKVKIDKSIVSNLVGNKSVIAKYLIKAVIDVARELNITLVAEGVETQAQLDALLAMGCNLVQGYYYHQALTKDEAIALIHNQK